MTSKITEKKPLSENAHNCSYCGRTFVRESTIQSHVCEQKRRWNDKDKPGNRIAYIAFDRFYKFNTNSKKKSYDDFVKSTYYIAFVKFGNYCAEVGVFAVERYVDWLIKSQVKIVDWVRDDTYQKFLLLYLREENPYDAIARSVETILDLAKKSSINGLDYLRWGNRNRICHNITTGKISPWILYQSQVGREFLDSLSEDEIKVIFEYINPERWSIFFHKNKDTVAEIKSMLTTIEKSDFT